MSNLRCVYSLQLPPVKKTGWLSLLEHKYLYPLLLRDFHWAGRTESTPSQVGLSSSGEDLWVDGTTEEWHNDGSSTSSSECSRYHRII